MSALQGATRTGGRPRPGLPARTWCGTRQCGAERGMVTVETALAVAMIAVVAVIASALPMAAAVSVRCGDVAREVALLDARGAPPGELSVAAESVGLVDPEVSVQSDNRWVRVTVTADATVPGPFAGRLSWPVSGQAVAQAEPGVGDAQ